MGEFVVQLYLRKLQFQLALSVASISNEKKKKSNNNKAHISRFKNKKKMTIPAREACAAVVDE